MNIIVIGCGKIGRCLIESLASEGHNVIAIDPNPTVISEITNLYDVMCVCGSGTDSDTLNEANVEKAELVISVTGSDEFNMLACFLAKRMGAKNTVARIRNPEYNDNSLGFLKYHLDLSVPINPEKLAARELFNVLKFPGALNIETFSTRNFEMVELKLKSDSALDGMKLIDVRKQYPGNYLVCAVGRDGETIIPDGNFVLKSGDKIGITAQPAEITRLLKKLGHLKKQARTVMILGASKTAYYLAKLLISSGVSVKIIELNETRCKEFSNALPEAVMINGDGTSQELLLEEGIDKVDGFVALTGMDEQNILVSIVASNHKVPKVITKVNRTELAQMAEKLGLDSIVSPKKTISNVICRYARALENSMGSNVETLYKIMDGSAEALEFNVGQVFKAADVQLKDISLKQGVLIAGIIRGRKTIIPSGNDAILQGDKVIVVAAGKKLSDLSDIIA
ncbi:MAG: Trk system potassium transporter TrkA [Clostridia bacterium]|nr:Trk system potassium transporter TrkA [Clostridia bacterium]